MKMNYLINVYTIKRPLTIAIYEYYGSGFSINVSKDICKTTQVLLTLQQFCCSVYTPNAAANALLDAALQDSHLASTLDRTIDPQSHVGFIHKAYTHHMAMRNALISLIEHVPQHQEIHTLFTLLQ